MEKWQHLERPFTDIEKATNYFDSKKYIGGGGFGDVYEGQLTLDGKVTKVAVKRLNEKFGQGLTEFLTEIASLSGQNHKNLISLMGYCNEGKKKIIVYEYAARKSLDKYIKKPSSYPPLTWLQRLKICVDAARGLDHLNNHVGIIHCDIKSANILLDDNWVAKISDLGLSKNIQGEKSFVISDACGTLGYYEPECLKTGFVKKESDVYSFGMVLFEVLCGRLCNTVDDDGFSIALKAKEYYENGSLDSKIDPNLRNQINNASMEKYKTIAYRCLQDRGQRPSINMVFQELKESLNLEDKSILLGPWGGDGGGHWDDGLHSGVKEITIFYGSCIDSIQVTYDNNGKPFSAKKHGGSGGTEKRIVLDFPNEVLIGISGHYFPVNYDGTTVIRSLTFLTNIQPHGPFGVAEGTPFNFSANGVHVVGLYGSSGWFVDSLGFCLSTNKRTNLHRDQMMSTKRPTSLRPPLPGAQGAPNTLDKLVMNMELLVYHHQRYQPFLERFAQLESEAAEIEFPEYKPPQIGIAKDVQRDPIDEVRVAGAPGWSQYGANDAIDLKNERDAGDDARDQVDIGTTNEKINLESMDYIQLY